MHAKSQQEFTIKASHCENNFANYTFTWYLIPFDFSRRHFLCFPVFGARRCQEELYCSYYSVPSYRLVYIKTF